MKKPGNVTRNGAEKWRRVQDGVIRQAVGVKLGIVGDVSAETHCFTAAGKSG